MTTREKWIRIETKVNAQGKVEKSLEGYLAVPLIPVYLAVFLVSTVLAIVVLVVLGVLVLGQKLVMKLFPRFMLRRTIRKCLKKLDRDHPRKVA